MAIIYDENSRLRLFSQASLQDADGYGGYVSFERDYAFGQADYGVEYVILLTPGYFADRLQNSRICA